MPLNFNGLFRARILDDGIEVFEREEGFKPQEGDLLAKLAARGKPHHVLKLPNKDIYVVAAIDQNPKSELEALEHLRGVLKPLLHLPQELLGHIASFLSFDDAAKLRDIFLDRVGRPAPFYRNDSTLLKKMMDEAWKAESGIQQLISTHGTLKFCIQPVMQLSSKVLSKMLVQMANRGVAISGVDGKYAPLVNAINDTIKLWRFYNLDQMLEVARGPYVYLDGKDGSGKKFLHSFLDHVRRSAVHNELNSGAQNKVKDILTIMMERHELVAIDQDNDLSLLLYPSAFWLLEYAVKEMKLDVNFIHQKSYENSSGEVRKINTTYLREMCIELFNDLHHIWGMPRYVSRYNSNYKDIIFKLLDLGANPLIEDETGYTAYCYIINYTNFKHYIHFKRGNEFVLDLKEDPDLKEALDLIEVNMQDAMAKNYKYVAYVRQVEVMEEDEPFNMDALDPENTCGVSLEGANGLEF